MSLPGDAAELLMQQLAKANLDLAKVNKTSPLQRELTDLQEAREKSAESQCQAGLVVQSFEADPSTPTISARLSPHVTGQGPIGVPFQTITGASGDTPSTPGTPSLMHM